MKTIPLTKGMYAIVDDVDYDYLVQFSWQYKRGPKHSSGYAKRGIFNEDGKASSLLMHRDIMVAKRGQYVDHINRNGIDNRRENLRFATPSQNAANSKRHKSNKSGYKGVFTHKQSGRWLAHIRINGKSTHVGIFDCPKEAHEAYMKAAREHYGDFASDGEVIR